MLISIDTRDSRSLYRQIADEIKRLIAAGELSPGQALPSVRQLAGDLTVNLNTVAAAYRALQDDGLIAIRHGRGARVTSRRTRAASPADLQGLMRGVLTQMVLAGMPRGAIRATVAAELRTMRKGAKP